MKQRKWLKEIREQKNMTQLEFSRASEYSSNYVCFMGTRSKKSKYR
jgi:hypothetical protein